MSNPQFHQAERRSLLVPALLALVLLVTAVGVARHYFPATSIDIDHLHTNLLPTHTVFATDTKIVGASQAQDVLFVATAARVRNGMQVPIFLDGASCTLTDQAGAILTVKAVEKSDLPNVETSFPKLKSLLQHPLFRDISIEPGKAAEGTLLLSFPFTEAQWKARTSAVIEMNIYHQHPVYLTIPN